jgi:hypothetical protein
MYFLATTRELNSGSEIDGAVSTTFRITELTLSIS